MSLADRKGFFVIGLDFILRLIALAVNIRMKQINKITISKGRLRLQLNCKLFKVDALVPVPVKFKRQISSFSLSYTISTSHRPGTF